MCMAMDFPVPFMSVENFPYVENGLNSMISTAQQRHNASKEAGLNHSEREGYVGLEQYRWEEREQCSTIVYNFSKEIIALDKRVLTKMVVKCEWL